MLINFIDNGHSEIIAAFCGSIMYIMIHDKYSGWRKISVFLISFFIGIQNGDIVASMIQSYLPASVVMENAMGSFICSLLTVTIAKNIIDIAKHFFHK
ncbi:putative holin [Enterobacter hormaechei]